MSKSFKIDLTGKKFGRLSVLEFVPVPNTKRSYWLCRCDCGNEKVIRGSDIRSGDTKSCGCLQIEKRTERIGKTNLIHNGSKSRLYKIWQCMKQRCYNPKSANYKRYGGRGIRICDEWLNDFAIFREWAIENNYSDNLSIDRIDNDKGYFPENCRFADAKTQQRNLRRNILIIYNDKTVTLAEASELSGINYRTLKDRYLRGDRGEELFRPVGK